MSEIIGDWGRFSVDGTSRYLSVPTDVARQYFDAIAIRKQSIFENTLGIYEFGKIGRFGKVKTASFTRPKHLLQSRKGCKTWRPKGAMRLNGNEFHTMPVEYMGEQCSDTLFGDCMEYFLGEGNEVRDITATPEGRILFAKMLEHIYFGLGESFYDLVTFGMHPLIERATDNEWWNKNEQTEAEWADYYDQQIEIEVKGHLSLIDEEKQDGKSHFNVRIKPEDITEDGEYVGDVIELFRACDKAMTRKFQIASKQARNAVPAIRLVHPMIFRAYERYLQATKGDNIQAYQFFITGQDNIIKPFNGVLRHDGKLIVCWDELEAFDIMTGTMNPRVVTTMPRNFLLAYDTDNVVGQYGGLGLQVTQHLADPWKGQVFMSTNFRAGAGIIDTDFMTNASLTITPKNN